MTAKPAQILKSLESASIRCSLSAEPSAELLDQSDIVVARNAASSLEREREREKERECVCACVRVCCPAELSGPDNSQAAGDAIAGG